MLSDIKSSIKGFWLLVMSLLRKRYDVLTHSYDFACDKSYDMIASLT